MLSTQFKFKLAMEDENNKNDIFIISHVSSFSRGPMFTSKGCSTAIKFGSIVTFKQAEMFDTSEFAFFCVLLLCVHSGNFSTNVLVFENVWYQSWNLQIFSKL